MKAGRNPISLVFAAALIVGAPAGAVASDVPPALQLLYAGKLAQAENTLTKSLERREDATDRYALGVVQFLGAVEQMGHSFYVHGLRNDVLGFAIPFLRLPVPTNEQPKPISYEDFRAIVRRFVSDVGDAERTLAAINADDVKLEIDLARIQLDVRRDGGELIPLKNIVARYLGGRRRLPPGGLPQVAFDRADVVWLRGYCHLLSAMAESFLAYDSRPAFDRTAQLFFPRAKIAYPFLLQSPDDKQRGFDWTEVIDAITLIHLIHWDVAEPERLKRAHDHLLRTISLSRECWELILQETDNDREWIPSPKQQSAIAVPVSQAQVDAWLAFTDEIERVLKGELLIPFWRGDGSYGVNLKRVFTEPRPFDLVFWVQGSGAAAYLEKGPQTKPEFWRRLQQVFRGQFIGFAMWFN